MSFWSKISSGKPFQADLSSAPRVRPRRIRAARWSGYEGFDSRRGTRPRCRAKGCQKHLRQEQPFACSPAHEKRVLSDLAELQRLVTRKEAA